MKISIIIPVYNSEKSLPKLNDEINNYFNNRFYEFEKIYVNDNSSDNSIVILDNIYNMEKDNVKVISLSKNYGQQNAIFCGMHYVTGDYIITMDDDLQHNIYDIDKMISEILSGNDLVYGVYDNHLNKPIRNLGSKMTGVFFRYNYSNLKGKRVSSFRIFTKDILIKTIECPYKFIYLSAIMLKHTDNISNVKIVQRKRDFGRSGYNFKKLLLLFLKLNFYYSKYSPEFIKPKNNAFEIKKILSFKKEMVYEKNNDGRSWELSIKRN